MKHDTKKKETPMAATVLALNLPGVSALPRSIPKANRPIQDTLIITAEHLSAWVRPDFQRPLLINDDVKTMAREMMLEAGRDERERMCTIPGTLIFGRFEGTDYLIDGQHRIYGAFALAAGLRALPGTTSFDVEGGWRPACAIASIEIRPYDSMAEMGKAFAGFNKKLVALKPDDLLRALEGTNTFLRDIREACPFIGYEKNKNTKERIMISMSAAIRTWFGSGATPATGPECSRAQSYLDEGETKAIVAFFSSAEAAGWVDTNYTRLWGTLNIGINMWLYRKLVLGAANKFRGGGDFMALTGEQYVECMKELRNLDYTKFLGSRALRYQDRAPTYDYIQELFLPALARMKIYGPKFPQPQGWSGGEL